MNDLDRLEALLERRGVLLGAATGLLRAAIRDGRPFTRREQEAWDYACGKIDELGRQFSVLAAGLAARRYCPRPSFTERAPR
jgi:hypothetical protein